MLRSEFRDLELDVSSLALQQLAVYANELEHWNRTVNLTSLHGNALIRRLIVDPVWVGQHLQMAGIVADVGSGNGSPGIPLAVTQKLSSTHLIEPRMKRAVFLRHMVAKLGLTDVVVDRCRVEAMPHQPWSFRWITLQAIEPTPQLIEALRKIAAETTRVVWITSLETPPAPSSTKLEIPGSNTRIWVFPLDQI